MLKEAYRVLKKGGIASFSIFGSEENSPMVTIANDVMAPYKKEQSESLRSNFHLGNRQNELREEILSYGFSTCLIWSNIMSCNFTTGEQCSANQCEMPRNKQFLSSLSGDAQLEIRNELAKRAQKWLDSGKPICFDVEIIMVTK